MRHHKNDSSATRPSFAACLYALLIKGCLGLLLLSLLPASARAQDDDGRKAPFITTPANVVDRMLALAGTTPADFVVDLGSGDGRIVIAAAKLGARAEGIELDPQLVVKSRDAARAAGVDARATFRTGDVFIDDYSSASVVTAYLLPWMLVKLEPTFLDKLRPDTRIVTHAFKFPGWQPDRTESVVVTAPDPKAGVRTTLFLWIVPAKARGEWRAASPGGDWRLRIQQNYQQIDVDAEAGGRKLAIASARMDGSRIAFSGTRGPGGAKFEFTGRVSGNGMAGELRSDGNAAPMPLNFTR